MQKKTSAKKEPKYITMSVFERAMVSIARSFEKVFEKFEQVDKSFELVDKRFELMKDRFDQNDKVLQTMLKELQNHSQEAREHRLLMSSLNSSDISQERKINGLEMRIEKLEQRIK